ncbi:MAG: glycoside hydrolase family 88 protein [Bacteroidota bacterium]|nr:glycoside hydrolase family 88 protein [Bacteroidota bacterium]
MRRINIILFAVFAVSAVFGQTTKTIKEFQNFPSNADPKKVGIIIAERFLSKPHSSTGSWCTEELIQKGGCYNCPVNHIVYPDVCTWYGSFTFSKLTGNTALANKLIKRCEPILAEEANLIPPANHVDNNVFGVIPLEVYFINKDKRYYDIGMRMADEQFKTLSNEEYAKLKPEVKEWYSMGYTWQTRFWMDDMYMITMIQTQAYRATGDKKYLDRTAREMVAYLDKLQQPNGLFHHAPDVPIFWGRGDGWLAAGMAELLRDLPKDNIYRPRIMDGYKKMMAALLKFQDSEGMWHQIITDPKAWKETSCTGMFTFAFITGVKNGWLDAKTYAPAARKAWIALCGYINEDGDVSDICEGTNKKNDYQYYLDRPKRIGDLHGQGPVLWCASALLR